MQFADIFNTPVKAAYITFLGPLLGSIMRPFGGKLADRHGGALVTTITFASMIAGGGLIVAASIASPDRIDRSSRVVRRRACEHGPASKLPVER